MIHAIRLSMILQKRNGQGAQAFDHAADNVNEHHAIQGALSRRLR